MALWRGDNDSQNIRLLRTTLPRAEGLGTNMLNGGNPLALQQQEFMQSIQNHVNPGWIHTHFLSFSKSKQVASSFAIGKSGRPLQASNQQQWANLPNTTLIVELDINCLSLKKNIAPGIDHFQYQELPLNQTLIQIPPLPSVASIARQCAYQNRQQAGLSSAKNILMIDVHHHLTHLQSCGVSISQQAIFNAQRDQEVLILPLDPISSGIGNTALLDFGCIVNIEYFELI